MTTSTAEEEQDSVREFLDLQRSGWGARFGAVFEDVGIETKEDLCFATEEEMVELDQKLAAMGAKSLHLRQIRDAVARLRSIEGTGGEVAKSKASSDPIGGVKAGASASSSSVESIAPWQTKKRYAAF